MNRKRRLVERHPFGVRRVAHVVQQKSVNLVVGDGIRRSGDEKSISVDLGVPNLGQRAAVVVGEEVVALRQHRRSFRISDVDRGEPVRRGDEGGVPVVPDDGFLRVLDGDVSERPVRVGFGLGDAPRRQQGRGSAPHGGSAQKLSPMHVGIIGRKRNKSAGGGTARETADNTDAPGRGRSFCVSRSRPFPTPSIHTRFEQPQRFWACVIICNYMASRYDAVLAAIPTLSGGGFVAGQFTSFPMTILGLLGAILVVGYALARPPV